MHGLPTFFGIDGIPLSITSARFPGPGRVPSPTADGTDVAGDGGIDPAVEIDE